MHRFLEDFRAASARLMTGSEYFASVMRMPPAIALDDEIFRNIARMSD
ncbi:hypothetical protein [Caballeronia sp. GAWG1-5s-s]|nr:hypothetical protein [Caballeronia sp. GAWG1-5s-s]